VESERDAIWLKQLGCKFAQGFHFSPPLPADEALKFIASHFRAEAAGGHWPEDATMRSGATGVG
jgi:sensor c-di-GMP phosphodiesterase-like protein